jgi:hypothetical protein
LNLASFLVIIGIAMGKILLLLIFASSSICAQELFLDPQTLRRQYEIIEEYLRFREQRKADDRFIEEELARADELRKEGLREEELRKREELIHREDFLGEVTFVIELYGKVYSEDGRKPVKGAKIVLEEIIFPLFKYNSLSGTRVVRDYSCIPLRFTILSDEGGKYRVRCKIRGMTRSLLKSSLDSLNRAHIFPKFKVYAPTHKGRKPGRIDIYLGFTNFGFAALNYSPSSKKYKVALKYGKPKEINFKRGKSGLIEVWDYGERKIIFLNE